MESPITPEFPKMELSFWRSTVTQPNDSEESPQPPVTPSCSVFFTPPSSGNANKKPTFVTETPRKIKDHPDLSNLPRQLKYQCGIAEKKTPLLIGMPSILEESETPESRKRTLPMLRLSSPKKKLCCQIRTPFEISRALCVHQKDNSPIKVDVGFGVGHHFPLILIPPPRRLDAPCPDQDFKLKDIISELEDFNMGLVIKQIFAHLAPSDLANAAAVSTRWKNLVHEFSALNISEVMKLNCVNKENICKTPVETPNSSGVVKSLNETTPLKNWIILNKNPSPKRKVPPLDLSPRSKRFSYYLREGKMLEKGESLTKCIKCLCPAKVSGQGSEAKCSMCHHSFCVLCKCVPHPGRSCYFSMPTSPSPPKKRQVIGSKASKKALRRLL